jgi:hypothetical protein
MNLAAIATLLQLATSLLTSVQNSSHVPQTIQEQAISLSSQAIQQGVQLWVTPLINFPTPKNNGIWPNITDLYNAAYISPDGGYTPLGTGVALVGEDTSFGDINGDGLDDAAVIVQRTDRTGKTNFALAAMLNQNGDMFNIGDAQLGSNVQVFSHHVVQGGNIVLNMQAGNNAAQTSTYELLGDQLIKL